MARFGRFLAVLPLVLLSPLLILVPVLAIAAADLSWRLCGRKRQGPSNAPRTHAASVVIPNWNGRALLEKYLPSVVEALSGHPDNEVIVVDNASEDGSARYIKSAFPGVRVVELERNEGFGGGSNAGFTAASNDIVVLLNSDMRVERNFLQPLLDGFTDENVFSVSCQIFFTDPKKLREETGLTQAWWSAGRLRVRHRTDPAIRDLFPCSYGGGGSCAFDRRKFLELGGFDELLRPFYLEDTDLGYMAWKRGWKVLYQPRSIVYHEHRGTIGKKFTSEYIQAVLKKNFVLFCWKNIHEWPRLLSHFGYAWADCVLSALFGDSPERTNFRGFWTALAQLPQALRSRWSARAAAAISDTEAFRRPLAGYFRDRFAVVPRTPDQLSVLFVSPYPICPPVHGGGVFMYQTCAELAGLCDLHLIVLLDHPDQRAAHEQLAEGCGSAEFLVRMTGRAHSFGSWLPHAVCEFHNQDLEWLIHRQIYVQQIDVVQLEYTPMGQYASDFGQIATILFEHDVYFQSIGRQLAHMGMSVRWFKAGFEYMRSLRYETKLLPVFDRVQVCSRENALYLQSFIPELASRIDDDLRAGIDTGRYPFVGGGREANTLLFVGGFRHAPNQEAITWFASEVLPLILQQSPEARLVLVGSDPPPRHFLPDLNGAVELRGFVEDVLEPLHRYAIFVCPILSGSGIRVKLLEAFSSGIPVVSTRIGAEGLAGRDGEICALADAPAEFAQRVVDLLRDPAGAGQMAQRARAYVEQSRDMRLITARLEKNYRETVTAKRLRAWGFSGRFPRQEPAELGQPVQKPPAGVGQGRTF
jgi:GT2 family glycosyltransferase/glycosyltransferase involved in cell wall biosynthesis